MENHNHGGLSSKHGLIMLLCCLVPMGLAAAILVFRIPTSTVVYGLVMLLCPALHLLMMRGMSHSGHHDSASARQVQPGQTVDHCAQIADAQRDGVSSEERSEQLSHASTTRY